MTLFKLAENQNTPAQDIIESYDNLGNKSFNLTSVETVAYDVISVTNLFNIDNRTLAHYNNGATVYCIIDEHVDKLYGDALRAYLRAYGIEFYSHTLVSSEFNKNIDEVQRFAAFCLDHGISRRDHILCMGGGIVCDIGALSANLIRRNTRCIKIPTSLLGIVDAAVGVKTGVNFGRIKNFLGTYCAPAYVLYDIDLLRTLPARHIRNGLVEILKMLALRDREKTLLLAEECAAFFNFPYGTIPNDIIDHAIMYMMEELQPNLRELNLRRIVDYGHEFGHPIEIDTDHELLHGEAVAIGMMISNLIAVKRGIMAVEDLQVFIDLYRNLDLPFIHHRISIESLASKIVDIQKHKNGNVDLVVLRRLGEPMFVESIDRADIEYAIARLYQLAEELAPAQMLQQTTGKVH